MKYFYFTLILLLSTAVIFSPKVWDNTYLKIAEKLKNNPQGVTNKQKEDIQKMFKIGQEHNYNATIRLGGFICMYYILEEKSPNLACAWLDSAELEYESVRSKIEETPHEKETRKNDIVFLSIEYSRSPVYKKGTAISTTDYWLSDNFCGLFRNS